MAHIFRADSDNAGDWSSPPLRYFPFRPGALCDLESPKLSLIDEELLIVGGGGLGRPYFTSPLNAIKKKRGRTLLIAWGVGVDSVVHPNKGVIAEGEYELFGEWFDGFDEVGVRAYSKEQKYRWVPCASSMHPEFFRQRERRPKAFLGIYCHRRAPLRLALPDSFPSMDNSGSDIAEKLKFLADHEYIVTNSYHGVFWATLLNRKVICIPFKSGLFSFKHPPTYCCERKLTKKFFDKAVSYPGSLEECRLANIDFYNYLTEKYGDI